MRARRRSSTVRKVLTQRRFSFWGPDEPLGAAVALRGANEGGGGGGAEPGDLLLEVVGHVLAAVVVADGEAAGRVLLDAAEALGHALPDRLERPWRVPCRAAWMPTHSAEQ